MKNFICFMSLLSLFSCTKDSLIDSISFTRYYKNEIFTDSNLKLYGQWQFLYIYADAGIVAGPGKINPTYDYLEIKKFGIYGKIKDNKVIESGQIVVIKQENSLFEINFKPDKKDSITDETLYAVIYTGKDSIIMRDASVGCGAYFNAYKRQN